MCLSSILALPSGATVTVIPISTVTSFVGGGGSITSGRAGSSTAGGGGPGGGNACLCHTCALTPTVVPGPCNSTSGPTGGSGGSAGTGTCKPRPGVGTTTLFLTHTITNCNKLPGVCPSSGYVIGGGGTKTQSGATVVTTTDKDGHTVTYTQIPTGPGGGGNGGTGTGTKGSVTTTTTAQPTCPYSNNVQFTSSMGMLYDILCNTYFTDETLDIQTQNSLGGCIAACDMYNTLSFMVASPCMGVSWYSMQNQDNCELKTGSHAVYQQGVNSARLRTPYTGPGGGNGTGPGGSGGSGGGGVTITGSMTSPPIVTTFVTGGSTVVTSIVTGGSTIVSTYVTGGSTVVQTVSGGGGGSGPGSGGNGPGGSGGNGPGGSGGNGPGGTGGGSGPGTGPGTGAGKSSMPRNARNALTDFW